MLFFTEGAINILAIAVLVQDDNQEIASVGYVWRPSGRETNNTDPLTWYPRPWWQQRAGGGRDVGWRGPWLGGTVRRPWNTQVKEITEGDPVRGDRANWNKRNFHKKKKNTLCMQAKDGNRKDSISLVWIWIIYTLYYLSISRNWTIGASPRSDGVLVSAPFFPLTFSTCHGHENCFDMSWTWNLPWHVLDMTPAFSRPNV